MLVFLTKRFAQRNASSSAGLIKLSEEVRTALSNGKGVVALESTIIAHGLPYPTNLSTGKELESIVRSEGAVPATIALLDGHIHVGLSNGELERIAEAKDVAKVSRRDMARCLAQKQVGATTVASTMWAAHQASIRVFATGGIGGVHRYADQTFDVSADLQELSVTPVTVVCAGVKSILDIPKTVEYLETHSVNTIVYSKENSFPGFFTPSTSSKGQFNTTDLELIARVIEKSRELGLPAGTVLACPIPMEYATEASTIEDAIQQALEEARQKNIVGQAATPFLLSRVKELTKGKSLEANVRLVKNNAKIAAKLANIMAANPKRGPVTAAQPHSISSASKPKVVTIGAAICDFEAITHENIKDDGGSYAGIVAQRPGGVGRNHADVLARLGIHSTFLTCLGNDENGNYLRRTGAHIDLSRVPIINDVPTATYFSINVKGNVRYGISSIEPIMEHITPELVNQNEDVIRSANFLVVDGNVKTETLKRAIECASKSGVPVWFEPTDIKKMQKLFHTGLAGDVAVCSPNLNEFREFCIHSKVRFHEKDFESPEQVAELIARNKQRLFRNLEFLIVTMAHKGTVLSYIRPSFGCEILPPPIDPSKVVSVSGSGDCFNGGFLASWLAGGSLEDRIRIAQSTAALTLRTTEAVSKDIQSII